MYNRKQFVCNNDDKMKELVKLFKTGTKRKRRFGNFTLDESGTISYTSTEKEGRGDNETTTKLVDIIAVRLKGSGTLLGNSALLRNVGSYSSYGHKQYNNEPTLIQTLLSNSSIPMIPFNAITQASLDVQDIVIVDQSADEHVVISEKYRDKEYKELSRDVNRHFTGASLFRVGDVHFLFDIDRREVVNKIFNPFIVQLPIPVNTISEAYQSLKPAVVLQAEKEGKEVLRQGEWFFIESEAPSIPEVSTLELLAIAGIARSWDIERLNIPKEEIAKLTALRDVLPRQLSLRAGSNRPNTVEKGLQSNGLTYVTGKVEHSGREHAKLVLVKWYTAHVNTATKSFTVTGDID